VTEAFRCSRLFEDIGDQPGSRRIHSFLSNDPWSRAGEEFDVESKSSSGLGPEGDVAEGGPNTPSTSAPVATVAMTKTRRPLRRKILVRLMFAGFSLLLGLVLVETVGRLVFRNIADDARFYARLEPNVIRSIPILECDRIPGTFNTKFGTVLTPKTTFKRPAFGRTTTEYTNSLGFRAREIEPRLPGEYRVLLVGDSYFYGAFMEEHETVAAQLEKMSESDKEARRPLRVFNYAIYGHCSVQELAIAQTYAPQVRPDIIILGFFAANDLIPNALTRIDDEGQFSPVPEHLERFRHDLKAELGLWQHSLIARFVYLTGPFSTRMVYRLGGQPWVLEQNFEVLRQFQRLCRQRACRFAVVFQHTTDSLASGWRAALYPSDNVQRRLSAFCTEAGIPSIDMRVEFHAAGDWTPFIIPKDAHCSALGVRKTAEAMYRDLIRPELVGQGGPGGSNSGTQASSPLNSAPVSQSR
jgi:hypothetical protein